MWCTLDGAAALPSDAANWCGPKDEATDAAAAVWPLDEEDATPLQEEGSPRSWSFGSLAQQVQKGPWKLGKIAWGYICDGRGYICDSSLGYICAARWQVIVSLMLHHCLFIQLSSPTNSTNRTKTSESKAVCDIIADVNLC